MKMNRKGFTLIELLAVIVILAVIALIASPIVLGIISNSQKSARARSVEAFAESAKDSYSSRMAIPGYMGEEIKFVKDGDKWYAAVDGKTTDADKIEVQYNGSRVDCTVNYAPEKGWMELVGCTVAGNKTETYYYCDAPDKCNGSGQTGGSTTNGGAKEVKESATPSTSA